MTSKYPFSKTGDAKLEFISMASDKMWNQYKDTILEMKKEVEKEYHGNMFEDVALDKQSDEAKRHFHRSSMVVKIDDKIVGCVVLKKGEFVNLVTDQNQFDNQLANNSVDWEQVNVVYALTRTGDQLNDVVSINKDPAEEKQFKTTLNYLELLASLRGLADTMVLLDTVYVKPEYRGYGVATRIYQKLFNEKWCSGAYVSYDHYKKYDWQQYCDSFSLLIGQDMNPEKMMISMWDSKRVPYKGLNLNDKTLLKEILRHQKLMWKTESIYNVVRRKLWLENTVKKLAEKYGSNHGRNVAPLVRHIREPFETLEGFRLGAYNTPQICAHSLNYDGEVDQMTTNTWIRQKGSELIDPKKSWANPQASYRKVLNARRDVAKQIVKSLQKHKQTA